ncbi:hypothetical protein J2Z64_004064 [Oceanobacillus polygoni]|uniref:Uncharacterized protein n=1 Tax=Oceanobacillus polygoni TaxID=1235259 RepID=A0A9X1CJE8_9BACI|nr:hypothetical protein [Oceanobacillus polygoni]
MNPVVGLGKVLKPRYGFFKVSNKSIAAFGALRVSVI